MAKSVGVIAVVSLVVGLAVGGVAGFVVGGSLSRDAETADGAASRPSADSRETAPAAETRAPRARAGGAETVDLGSIQVDVPPEPRGDGEIKGVVRTAAGAPLAGVLVRATSTASSGEDRDERANDLGAPPPGIEQEVREFVVRMKREESRQHDALTDASGAFAITGLATGEYQLAAWLKGWRIERENSHDWKPVRTGTQRDFVATPIRGAHVSLVLPDGTAPAWGLVTWNRNDGRPADSAEWHRDEPQIELPTGTLELRATSDPDHERFMWQQDERAPLYSSEPQTVTVSEDGPTNVTLHLTATPGILVKLTFAGAERPRHVRIAALALEGGAAPEASRLLAQDESIHSRWIENGDEGALTGLAPGSYLVGVTLRGGRVGPTAVVTVANSLVTQPLQIDAKDSRDWVKVWVRTPDGQAVRDVTLECGCRSATGSGEAEIGAYPDLDDSWRVEHYEKDSPSLGSSASSGGELGIEGRTYFVSAKSERYGEAEATYDPATDTEVTIRFTEPARLRATVEGFASSPDRSRVTLTLERSRRSARGEYRIWEGTLDKQGVATFPPLAPGEYELVLGLAEQDDGVTHGRRRYRGSNEIARTKVTLESGDATASVVLPALTSFVVTFEKSLGISTIQIQSMTAEGTPNGVVADLGPEGGGSEIQFKDLGITPGRYRLVARDIGDMWVDLPGPERIVFRPRPFNALQVRTAGYEPGYLHEAGLRNGDVVVAVDGTELENMLQINACLAVARSHETAKLTVLRAGRRFDTTVDPKRLEDGGRLAPWVR